MEACRASFSKTTLLNVQKISLSGSFNQYIVNTNYQKVHKLTLLHKERLGKNQKSNIAGKFTGSAKFRSPAKFHSGCKNS